MRGYRITNIEYGAPGLGIVEVTYNATTHKTNIRHAQYSDADLKKVRNGPAIIDGTTYQVTDWSNYGYITLPGDKSGDITTNSTVWAFTAADGYHEYVSAADRGKLTITVANDFSPDVVTGSKLRLFGIGNNWFLHKKILDVTVVNNNTLTVNISSIPGSWASWTESGMIQAPYVERPCESRLKIYPVNLADHNNTDAVDPGVGNMTFGNAVDGQRYSSFRSTANAVTINSLVSDYDVFAFTDVFFKKGDVSRFRLYADLNKTELVEDQEIQQSPRYDLSAIPGVDMPGIDQDGYDVDQPIHYLLFERVSIDNVAVTQVDMQSVVGFVQFGEVFIANEIQFDNGLSNGLRKINEIPFDTSSRSKALQYFSGNDFHVDRYEWSIQMTTQRDAEIARRWMQKGQKMFFRALPDSESERMYSMFGVIERPPQITRSGVAYTIEGEISDEKASH